MPPDYWTQAISDLSHQDALMAELVERFAGLSLVSRGDPFATLARSIVGQQISVKAADSVWGRFLAQVGSVAPERILALGESGLTGCGLSKRKVEYLCDLAGHFSSGQLDPSAWSTLDDEAIITELVAVRGIGRWTAEMFLIFNLMRPDVFPLDDIGLQRAVNDRYFKGEKQPRKTLAAFGERWRPWRSVATWYLWRSLDPVPVEY
ncbi:MAG: DNA-3-methyladenine glycosylase [Proteobacteria bacterium]|nr:DNA-3-methyladenine glycosylase [Pseudomonadota bacterium]